MKKIAIAMLAALSFGAFAADYLEVAVDQVNGRKGGSDSTAQYVRAGKAFGDYQVGVQQRTAKFTDNSVGTSTEAYLSNSKVSAFGITPFVGMGHDYGSGSNQSYNYGLVGATAGMQVGPGFALVGVKARTGTTEIGTRTKQTLSFASYSVPVAKNVAVNLNASRSAQDIKEAAFGLGLSVGF